MSRAGRSGSRIGPVARTGHLAAVRRRLSCATTAEAFAPWRFRVPVHVRVRSCCHTYQSGCEIENEHIASVSLGRISISPSSQAPSAPVPLASGAPTTGGAVAVWVVDLESHRSRVRGGGISHRSHLESHPADVEPHPDPRSVSLDVPSTGLNRLISVVRFENRPVRPTGSVRFRSQNRIGRCDIGGIESDEPAGSTGRRGAGLVRTGPAYTGRPSGLPVVRGDRIGSGARFNTEGNTDPGERADAGRRCPRSRSRVTGP
jgi:hypothetical protein